MSDNSKSSKYEKYSKCKEAGLSNCEKLCECQCGKLCYNNKNCCYLHPKDISIIQVNDKNLEQSVVDFNNLYLTATQPDINTAGYTIESSALQRPNDTLVIDDEGIYSIDLSFKYTFKFNENIQMGDVFRVNLIIKGNGDDILNIENTVIVPSIINGESKEIVNTIKGKKLQIIGEKLPYKINISFNEFDFSSMVLNHIVVSDLILIVEKII